MLPSDLVLVQDDAFKKHVLAYAKDQEVRPRASACVRRPSPDTLCCAQLFYSDFSKAFQKLEELGTSNLVSVA